MGIWLHFDLDVYESAFDFWCGEMYIWCAFELRASIWLHFDLDF